MGKRVLVLGWYGKGNLGDESFKEAFQTLWPRHAFDFYDAVPPGANEQYDACMIGGGSFLDAGIPGIEKLKLPTAFVGIGACALKDMKPAMAAALMDAKAVVVRDSASEAHLAKAGVECRGVGDLFFARPVPSSWIGRDSKAITVMLSEHVAPRGADCPEWKAASWNWFCRELAGTLDELVGDGYFVCFLPMSRTNEWDDTRAAAAVVTRMRRASVVTWDMDPSEYDYGDPDAVCRRIAESNLVISSRLHGAIFSAAVGAPCLAIAAHEKMESFALDACVNQNSYYACSRGQLLAGVRGALKGDWAAQTKSYVEGARRAWLDAAAYVTAALSL